MLWAIEEIQLVIHCLPILSVEKSKNVVSLDFFDSSTSWLKENDLIF